MRWLSGDQTTPTKNSPCSALTILRESWPFAPITQISELKTVELKAISDPSGDTDQASAPPRISRGAPPSTETAQTLDRSAPSEVACASNLVPSGNQPTGNHPVIL